MLAKYSCGAELAVWLFLVDLLFQDLQPEQSMEQNYSVDHIHAKGNYQCGEGLFFTYVYGQDSYIYYTKESNYTAVIVQNSKVNRYLQGSLIAKYVILAALLFQYVLIFFYFLQF